MITIVLKTRVPDENGTLVLKDVVLAESGSVDRFYMENGLNTRISGYFTIVDSDHTFINTLSLSSDVEGYVILNNSYNMLGDDGGNSSKVDIIVTNWEQISVNGIDTNIKFEFVGGRYVDEVRTTQVYSGNSIEAMASVIKSRKALYELGSDRVARLTGNAASELKPVDKPSQTGGWYSFNDNMFTALDYISKHSLKFNDYIFWTYDDLNSNYTLSSIAESNSVADRFVFIWTNQTGFYPVATSDTSPFRVIMPESYSVRSTYGNNYETVFPNVTYTVGFNNSIDTSKVDFNNYLKSIGGRPIDFGGGSSVEFSDILDIDSPSYGPRKIKQMSNLNTHKLHAFAEDYHEFKYATFSKKIDVSVGSTFGPPVGEYVTFLSTDIASLNQGFTEFEKTYSDRYIIEKKVIKYNGTGNNLNTQLTLMSDNKTSGLGEEVYSIYKTIKDTWAGRK